MRITGAFLYFGLIFFAEIFNSALAQSPMKDQNPSTASRAELLFWDSIKDSTDPTDYRDYLSAFPNGFFAGPAQRRVREMEPSPTNSVQTPEQEDGKSTEPTPLSVQRNKNPPGTDGWIAKGYPILDQPEAPETHRLFVPNEIYWDPARKGDPRGTGRFLITLSNPNIEPILNIRMFLFQSIGQGRIRQTAHQGRPFFIDRREARTFRSWESNRPANPVLCWEHDFTDQHKRVFRIIHLEAIQVGAIAGETSQEPDPHAAAVVYSPMFPSKSRISELANPCIALADIGGGLMSSTQNHLSAAAGVSPGWVTAPYPQLSDRKVDAPTPLDMFNEIFWFEQHGSKNQFYVHPSNVSDQPIENIRFYIFEDHGSSIRLLLHHGTRPFRLDGHFSRVFSYDHPTPPEAAVICWEFDAKNGPGRQYDVVSLRPSTDDIQTGKNTDSVNSGLLYYQPVRPPHLRFSAESNPCMSLLMQE